MQIWEYNYIVFKLETGMSVKEVIRLDQLNAAGKDGWELVNVLPLGQSFLLYTFKRPTGEVSAAKTRNQAASVNTGTQSRAAAPKAKTRSLRDIQVDAQQYPQPQAEPQPEAQQGINFQDILNSILGGGDGKF